MQGCEESVKVITIWQLLIVPMNNLVNAKIVLVSDMVI
jgi:hypothetical protein